MSNKSNTIHFNTCNYHICKEKAKYQQDMTTERDIRNFITFAREEGMEKGREETRKLVTERLRERGFSEEEIQSILADKES